MNDSAPQAIVQASGGRIQSMDVLRGFALLGILLMNVQSYSMPNAAYSNPRVYGDLTGGNFLAWLGCFLTTDLKFLTLFSMLFGAGLVIGTERGRQLGGHLRRLGWLFFFGLLHGYLLWYGDILVSYALAGLVVLVFRHRPARRLLTVAIGVLGVPVLLWTVMILTFRYWPASLRQQAQDAWSPSAAMIELELSAYRSGWLGQFADRTSRAFQIETSGFFSLYGWRSAGCMLLGMAFHRMGIIAAARSPRFYRRLAVVGFSLGLPLAGVGAYCILTGSRIETSFFLGSLLNYIAAVPVGLGWLALTMLACQSGALARPMNMVAALGRVAFTAYIGQTVVATFVFYGHGLGLYGQVSRVWQGVFAFGLWSVQLKMAPLWLRYFRMGPLEWAWRSLAEGRILPFKREVEVV